MYRKKPGVMFPKRRRHRAPEGEKNKKVPFDKGLDTQGLSRVENRRNMLLPI